MAGREKMSAFAGFSRPIVQREISRHETEQNQKVFPMQDFVRRASFSKRRVKYNEKAIWVKS